VTAYCLLFIADCGLSGAYCFCHILCIVLLRPFFSSSVCFVSFLVCLVVLNFIKFAYVLL